jgi:hypothetical protein
LNFDTILFIKTDYVPQKNEIDFTLTDSSVFIVGCNENTGNEYNFSSYDNNDFKKSKDFILKSKFKQNGIVDIDIHKNIYGILSHNTSLLIYRLTEKDTILIRNKISFYNNKNSFDNIKIISDSVAVLTRAYKYLKQKKEEAVCVLYYNFIDDKELKRFYIDTEISELGYFTPNRRINFYDGNTYVCDFNKYIIYEMNQNSVAPIKIINDTNLFGSAFIKKHELEKARMACLEDNNVGPMLNFLQGYLMDSMFVLTDIHVLNDSVILTRCIKPKTDSSSQMNNFIDIWIKDKDLFKLNKSLSDPIQYGALKNNDEHYNKQSYSKWTATNRYKIRGNRIYFLFWTSEVYPIGLSKSEFNIKDRQYLDKHPAIPAIVVYEFKEDLFKK